MRRRDAQGLTAECLSAAGYAGLLMVLIGCAALAIHAWAAWWTR